MTHFDVKPSNLLVSSSDDAKAHPAGVRVLLADFGSAEYSEPGATTSGYTSLEVLQMWQAGPLSDVWSAGVVFAELVSGTWLPWIFCVCFLSCGCAAQIIPSSQLMDGRLFPEAKCDSTESKAIMSAPHE